MHATKLNLILVQRRSAISLQYKTITVQSFKKNIQLNMLNIRIKNKYQRHPSLFGSSLEPKCVMADIHLPRGGSSLSQPVSSPICGYSTSYQVYKRLYPCSQ